VMYQRHTLSEMFDPRVNSFTLVRLVFATAVAYVHALSFAGGTFEPFMMLHARHIENMASISVEGFFIISGFLITRSYVHAPSTPRYLWHRFLRIFPGFWISILVAALIVGPLIVLIKGGSLTAYFSTPVNGPWTFITANGLLSIGQWALADTTEGLPFPIAINGSLWTLRPEFDCYLIVAALGLLGSRIGLPRRAVTCAGARVGGAGA